MHCTYVTSPFHAKSRMFVLLVWKYCLHEKSVIKLNGCVKHFPKHFYNMESNLDNILNFKIR